MIENATDSGKVRRLRQLLYAMVILLVVEGLARKAAPSILSIPIFLLKDVFSVAMVFYVVQIRMNPMIRSLGAAYIILAILMIPLVVLTATHDFLLAMYGAKQYLLYPVIGFAIFMAFENSKMEDIFVFYRRVALLLIPTVLLAVVQLKLPHNSWLNMSVNGESLEGFSSEGQLRVSSSFPFVAQFCVFLNAEIFIIFIALHGWSRLTFRWRMVTLSFMPLILIGSFITGSRGAVVVNLSIILLALMLGMLKFRAGNIFQILMIIIFLYVAVLAIHYFFPSVMQVYSNREEGHLIGISSEIRHRVLGSFNVFGGEASYKTAFGNGLGVMSNGVESVSNYAAQWRYRIWTETDFGTTVFEGGSYLVLVWYGFRIFVIFKTLSNFLSDTTPEYSVPMAFCQGFVIVLGLFGTLALQPPIAIWWWFGVGTSLLFSWKCVAPPDSDGPTEEPKFPIRRKIRGRSLYAEVIHTQK